MKVKVCGMREADNIREVERLQVGDGTSEMALGIDLMGFIFWPKSKRYVAEPPSYLPSHVKKVGVFVDASLEDIRQHIQDYQLDFVQLHGHESPAFAQALKPTMIIKAFNIATAEDFLQTKPYEGIADYFLFDTKAQLPGGTGLQFDWSILSHYDGTTPFILSGGIGPDDADRLKAFLTSQSTPLTSKCIGIDLNSRFELAPALKDVNRLKDFLNALNNE